MYAVLQIDLNYDLIEGVECYATFATEEEANAYRKGIIDKTNNDWRKWADYIDKYVDNITIPSDITWAEFIKPYPSYLQYRAPNSFHSNLKSYLRQHLEFKKEDFNPPPRPNANNYLFVVKIKDIQK